MWQKIVIKIILTVLIALVLFVVEVKWHFSTFLLLS